MSSDHAAVTPAGVGSIEEDSEGVAMFQMVDTRSQANEPFVTPFDALREHAMVSLSAQGLHQEGISMGGMILLLGIPLLSFIGLLFCYMSARQGHGFPWNAHNKPLLVPFDDDLRTPNHLMWPPQAAIHSAVYGADTESQCSYAEQAQLDEENDKSDILCRSMLVPHANGMQLALEGPVDIVPWKQEASWSIHTGDPKDVSMHIFASETGHSPGIMMESVLMQPCAHLDTSHAVAFAGQPPPRDRYVVIHRNSSRSFEPFIEVRATPDGFFKAWRCVEGGDGTIQRGREIARISGQGSAVTVTDVQGVLFGSVVKTNDTSCKHLMRVGGGADALLVASLLIATVKLSNPLAQHFSDKLQRATGHCLL
eukprot:CAMPEP_0194519736 /NCGR_PEP_ID=MMETSP0253-20130528/53468_1 /TAXON_ID=2966 /ORGANISM="Noctiluca scintillans" /LENGTH=366 /DNA_ID=CAMNT_0039363899 /DNA_START=204 /DNA_END=1304 /DNA_ORIENTATION=+